MPDDINTTVSGWVLSGMSADQISTSVAASLRSAAIAQILTHIPVRPEGFDASMVLGLVQSLLAIQALSLPLSPAEAVGYYVDAVKDGSDTPEKLDKQWALGLMTIGAMVSSSNRGPELTALLPPEEEA